MPRHVRVILHISICHFVDVPSPSQSHSLSRPADCDRFLSSQMSAFVLCMGLSMVAASVLAASTVVYLGTPAGSALILCSYYYVITVQSLSRVLIFQPPEQSAPTKAVAVPAEMRVHASSSPQESLGTRQPVPQPKIGNPMFYSNLPRQDTQRDTQEPIPQDDEFARSMDDEFKDEGGPRTLYSSSVLSDMVPSALVGHQPGCA